jgi:hypothetical protein
MIGNTKRIGLAIGVAVLMGVATAASAQTEPEIHIEDVELFFKIYEAAGGRPTADQLQRDYIAAGSDGLRQFAKLRNISGVRIADTLSKQPQLYSNARGCMAVLPRVRERLKGALRELARQYPQGRFPPVTIAVGRGKPIGIGSPVTGIQIGLEALCATEYFDPNVEERFMYVIVHEYAHALQVAELVDKKKLTVLEGALMEGAAEFTAELILGKPAYSRFTAMTRGREKEIETAFAADLDNTEVSAWLYNGTMEKPGDLGYWIGHRIVRAYYQRASDKRQALRDILELTDAQAKAFLAGSGWYPGIPLD